MFISSSKNLKVDTRKSSRNGKSSGEDEGTMRNVETGGSVKSENSNSYSEYVEEQ